MTLGLVAFEARMQAILQIFDVVLPLAYAGVFAAYLLQFFRDDQDTTAARYALMGLLGAHVLYFVLRGAHHHYLPLASKEEFLSMLALSVTGVYTLIERTQHQTRTGAFFLAPALFAQSVASVFMGYSTKHPILLENPVYGVHVVLLVFGLTALAVGALYALMYVLMSRQLKARDLGMFFKRLPPLATLEKMSKVGTIAGIALLGFGLLMGFLVGFSVEVDLFNPKIIITNVIWLGYVAGFIVSRVRGLSGMQVAWATMLWFAVLLISVGATDHTFIG